MSIVNPTNDLEKKVNRDMFCVQRLAEEKQIWMQAYCASLAGQCPHPESDPSTFLEDAEGALREFNERFYPENSK